VEVRDVVASDRVRMEKVLIDRWGSSSIAHRDDLVNAAERPELRSGRAGRPQAVAAP
jgi:hypothetical protein